MIACPGCGYQAADDFAFCPRCAASLVTTLSIPPERKVITTLFCDLVAFTAMSEAVDPEDVDAILRKYDAAARKVIESHGGTVEKFIGDAVVGVFGVPVVHEDDPERAVRAGLRIVEALDGMTRPDGSPLQARVGVNTGEALVRLDVDPSSGRGLLAGDAVNTAARLQAAAPPVGVVGALTHELTARVVDYEELPPVAAKGKAGAVTAWLARSPVSRTGVGLETPLTPLVDRETELSFLRSLFERAAATSSPEVVLVIGEPGIGKSRLVRELFAYVDSRPEMTRWRQGRCLAYGEGVVFWPLAEIVKAQAGVLETDDLESLERKLEAVLPDGEDRAWFRQRLRALLGLEAPQASREENFTAWLRFLEELAAAGPTVLVFEDLHWADLALLAFLEHLADNLADVPLLVIATARPELLEANVPFGGASSASSSSRSRPQIPRRWSTRCSAKRRPARARPSSPTCKATPSSPRSRHASCASMGTIAGRAPAGSRWPPQSRRSSPLASTPWRPRQRASWPTPPWWARSSGKAQSSRSANGRRRRQTRPWTSSPPGS